MKYVPLRAIKSNPDNPRTISDDDFENLVTSIANFPEMLSKRPLVCITDTDGKIMPLGGNQRLRAFPEAEKMLTKRVKEFKEDRDVKNLELLKKGIPVEMADEFTEDQRKEFIVKDNVSSGEWDFERLKEEFDIDKLEAWGLEIPKFKEPAEKDVSFKIKQSFKVEVVCESEDQQEKVFNELTKQGYECRILSF